MNIKDLKSPTVISTPGTGATNINQLKPGTFRVVNTPNTQPLTNAPGVFQKTANFFGKALNIGAKLSGATALVEAAAPAAQGIARLGSQLQGNVGEQFRQNQDLGAPVGEAMRVASEKGTGAGIKNVAGNLLEAGGTAAAFATGIPGAPAALTPFIERFPTVARYLGYGTTGAAYGGTFGAAKGLKENKSTKGVIGELLSGAKTGAILGVAVPALVEGTVRAVKNVSALYSGVPRDALQRAFDNPESVGEAVRRYAKDPEQTQGVLTKANEALTKIKEQRAADYEKALASISGKQTKLSKEGVQSYLDGVLSSFNPKILDKAEQAKIKELQALINEWDDVTPVGLNELRRAIANRITAGNSNELNRIFVTTKNNLADYVAKKVPEVADMNAAYAKASDFIDNLQTEIFGKGNAVKDSTKLNRLLTVFNQKSDLRHNLINQLGEKAGIDLLNEITGSAMASWLPTGWVQRFVLAGSGLTGILSPNVLATAPMASPRIVGKAARVLGKLDRVVPTISKKLQPVVTKKIINP